MNTKCLHYYLTRIENHHVAIGSRPQTIEDVKALLDANDVAIDRALGALHANGSIKLVETTDEGLVETIVQARWLN
ncbi:hypothetical protein [Rhizobium sp. PL01]|uniref:hypothetical protein n=1 Tax=Rhizobium sp. PL01 TaxID=3085631 RepID=UPI00298227CB|nr:hypothetical protein [Rhizobium sp. PL01]MDW5318505.1 hypothetical protein [Rhizobium sp. PL01]